MHAYACCLAASERACTYAPQQHACKTSFVHDLMHKAGKYKQAALLIAMFTRVYY